MIQFLIVFGLITSFDWIDIVKEKRNNEIVLYLLTSILVITGAYIAYSSKINTSISEIVLEVFNM